MKKLVPRPTECAMTTNACELLRLNTGKLIKAGCVRSKADSRCAATPASPTVTAFSLADWGNITQASRALLSPGGTVPD